MTTLMIITALCSAVTALYFRSKYKGIHSDKQNLEKEFSNLKKTNVALEQSLARREKYIDDMTDTHAKLKNRFLRLLTKGKKKIEIKVTKKEFKELDKKEDHEVKSLRLYWDTYKKKVVEPYYEEPVDYDIAKVIFEDEYLTHTKTFVISRISFSNIDGDKSIHVLLGEAVNKKVRE